MRQEREKASKRGVNARFLRPERGVICRILCLLQAWVSPERRCQIYCNSLLFRKLNGCFDTVGSLSLRVSVSLKVVFVLSSYISI